MWRLGAAVDATGLLLLAALAGCATDAPTTPAGLGGLRGQSALIAAPEVAATAAGAGAQPAAADASAAAAEAPATIDAVTGAERERQLRQELATADDPVPAALELADLLGALERHREALAVVETALTRGEVPALQVCRAGLLRDLGRRGEAAAALQALLRAHGPAAMHPGLLFELAELHWLVGDHDGAEATLRDLRQAHGDDPWCTSNAAALDGLGEELATASAPPRVRVRDLLGSLRGGATVADRVRLLGELVAMADRETDARREYLRGRALAIACGDDSPAVRARAVQLMQPHPDDAESFCREALADPAPLVRRCAAERAAECLRGDAVPLLLAALEREDDADAFAAMHAQLRQLCEAGPELQDAADPAARAEVRHAWRQRCNP